MTVIDILRIIIGLPLALFVTGWLLAITWFSELQKLEKIALAFVLSICIDIALGLFLGYNKQMKDLTGGITAENLWFYLTAITLLLIVIYYFKTRKEKRKKEEEFLGIKEF